MEHSRKIYDDISELFIAFNKGSKVLGVQEYNGGLFDGIIPNKIFFYDLQDPSFFSDVRQYSKLSKSIKLDEKSEKILQQFQNQINPIITNLLIMDSFDFNSEVNVNILGHIFEQSISDIEALKEKKDSRRKKEGVYYTPEEITSYLCRNTILPYLSKSGKTTIFGLIQEYKENIEELEAKFDDLKILDPACGSGAFLNKAIDILLDLHHQIQIHKGSEQTTAGQKQLTEWNETDRALAIIERNIYGVDINQESVDISKLSLFLKIASPTRKLTNLSNYLKVGNSIVEDRSLDQKGFLWENEFPEVLKIDKFDIVIGNPPYGEEIPKDYKKYFKENYASATGRYDSYFYFIEKGISFLRDQGELGFIVPDTWLTNVQSQKLREFVLDNCSIKQIMSLPQNVFPDATVDTCLVILKKEESEKNRLKNKIEVIIYDKDAEVHNIQQEKFLSKINVIQKQWHEDPRKLFNVYMDDKKLIIIIK